ncbi:MAG TPA: TetR/AcrR family transcriptional regulator [Mycobacteriales bacterium]|nr:TetR/AcrR family transcriptional regulator [Mycobacteriales bacterium]
MQPHEGAGRSAGVLPEPAIPGSPRGVARESAICAAALELLAEVGYDRMSMDAVAGRAKASKATIYRRWPGKRELVEYAIRCRGPQHMEPPDTGSLRGDIIATLRSAAEGFAAEDVALLTGVLRAMRGAPEIATTLRQQMLVDKREMGATIIRRAVERGEIRPDADPGVFHEVAPALMFFRMLVTGEPIDDEFVTHVADDVLIPLLACSSGNRRDAAGTTGSTRSTVPSARQETS